MKFMASLTGHAIEDMMMAFLREKAEATVG
jgi:hypothetical protein